MPENEQVSGGPQRRLPQNLQGLLRFCMEVDDSPALRGSAAESQFTEMLPERREWLREAISSITVDLIKKLRESMSAVLQALEQGEHAESDVLQAAEEALCTMTELCEDINLACDFVKIGGLELIPALLEDSLATNLRTMGARLIASLTQNNPFCQEAIIPHIELLIHRLDVESSVEARCAALGAISCLIRGHASALARFYNLKGFTSLMNCMQAEDDRLRTKAAFLLSALFSTEEDELDVDVLLKSDVPTHLIMHFVSSEQQEFHHEYLLAALRSLVERSALVRSNITENIDDVGKVLLDALQRREALLLESENIEQYRESLEHCQQLRHLLFEDFSANQVIMDR